MYIVKKQRKIEEELCIQSADGKDELKITVSLDVDDILANYNKARRELGKNQRAMEENPKSEEAMIALGASIVHLFEIIFGEEDTKKILDCYENRYIEMLGDIAPFIAEVIQPQIEAAVRSREDKYRAIVDKRRKGAATHG